MRASKRSRNQDTKPASASSPASPVRFAIPQDIKDDIVDVVRHLTLVTAGGTCALRAYVGNEVLRRLGFDAKLTHGSMLYRAGPHKLRDVMAYCGRGNAGYVEPSVGMLGHIWNELDGDLIDFSCGDWQNEAVMINATSPDGLGDVQFDATPPAYLWQRAAPLKAAWKSSGEPKLGEFWYGPWVGTFYPDKDGFDFAFDVALNQIDHNIAEKRLVERLAAVGSV